MRRHSYQAAHSKGSEVISLELSKGRSLKTCGACQVRGIPVLVPACALVHPGLSRHHAGRMLAQFSSQAAALAPGLRLLLAALGVCSPD